MSCSFNYFPHGKPNLTMGGEDCRGRMGSRAFTDPGTCISYLYSRLRDENGCAARTMERLGVQLELWSLSV